MNKTDEIPLYARVEQLENTVSALQIQVEQLNQVIGQVDLPASTPSDLRVAVVETAVSTTKITPDLTEPIPITPTQPKEPPPYLQSEFWLNKVGIGLMLFALVFLFRYAIDQGWLTPSIRVAFGVLLGTILLLFGLRTYETRRPFSVVLLGGGVVSYYITIVAAFQLYQLIPHPTAFGLMVSVTLLACALSLRQNEAVLALIGTIGGFLTPLLLYSGDDNIQGLMLYICLLIAGAITVYFFRGWRILLWTSAMLGWSIIGLTSFDMAFGRETAVNADKFAVQASILFIWLAFWAIPLLRQLLNQNDTSSLHPLSIGFADAYLPESVKQWLGNDLHVLTFLAALFLMNSRQLWTITDTEWGLLLISFALLYGLIAFYLRRIPTLENLGITHGLTATFLLTIAFLVLLDDEALLIALTVEAIVWHFFNSRLGNRFVQFAVHLFSLIIGVWVFTRLLDIHSTDAITAVRILTDLAVIIGFAGVAIIWLPAFEQRVYLLAAHIAILMLMWRELSELANGQALISVFWGIYAIILLIIGLRSRFGSLRTVGLATLFVLVGKLFLIDLDNVKSIWRILLFFGFGGVFLLLSYFYQKLWTAKTSSNETAYTNHDLK